MSLTNTKSEYSIQEAFNALNSFKRHRALKEDRKIDIQYHDLQMYKMIDKLELSLRAINKMIRENFNDSEQLEDLTEDESS